MSFKHTVQEILLNLEKKTLEVNNFFVVFTMHKQKQTNALRKIFLVENRCSTKCHFGNGRLLLKTIIKNWQGAIH